MTRAPLDVETSVPAELYADVQQFYAWQMGLLDDGKPDEWADTFTVDAVFGEPGKAGGFSGREAIRASVRERAERLAAEGVVIRHWFSMLVVRPQPDGTLRTRNYALTLATPRGGALTVRGHAVCHDHLVPDGDRLLVAHRLILPDGR
ncbi:SnoaL-like protein [Saccharothrix carnea]|uniref:SnoaL-like protein n=1 Tax=Saccharothrix carnea TaxID=1280637 RepID=A0A2P8I2J1_SACCR|nr:nuclear transport factor 2 family protein [Saccharothrix carnea]PSL52684.1 SnoaL-like protein [Saccharothrix carnea]